MANENAENIEEEAPLTPKQVDELFDRMQKLLDTLPDMEDKSRKAIRARRATEVVRLGKYHRSEATTLSQIERLFDEHMVARKEALETGDEKHEEEERLVALQLNNQLGYLRGAEENARVNFQQALDESGFKSLEEAETALLSKEELAALEEELDEFQTDYSTTLEACQRTLDAKNTSKKDQPKQGEAEA